VQRLLVVVLQRAAKREPRSTDDGVSVLEVLVLRGEEASEERLVLLVPVFGVRRERTRTQRRQDRLARRDPLVNGRLRLRERLAQK
jgi:hypothetical protein